MLQPSLFDEEELMVYTPKQLTVLYLELAKEFNKIKIELDEINMYITKHLCGDGK